MKILVLSLTILSSLAGVAARADDDCTLSANALVGALNLGSPQFQKGEFALVERVYTETVTFKDGVRLTYTVSGCEHYAFSYTFENLPKGDIKDARGAMLELVKRLNRLPLKGETDVTSLSVVVRALQKAAPHAVNVPVVVDEYSLLSGDANSAFTGAEVDGKLNLKVSYDFAL